MKPLRLAFLAFAVAFLAGCAGRSVQQVSVLPDVQKIGNLEGSYSMKFTSDGETRYATASVKKIAQRQYQIARVTVYGPTVYTFVIGEDYHMQTSLGTARYQQYQTCAHLLG